MGSNLAELSIGVLSFKAHKTIRNSLHNHDKAGLLKLTSDFFIYFNAIDEYDRNIASDFNLNFYGDIQNSGIYGGFLKIAEHAQRPYVLVLESDLVTTTSPEELLKCLDSCLTDMKVQKIDIFNLRSRHNPGQGKNTEKYTRSFSLKDPLNVDLNGKKTSTISKLHMQIKHGGTDKLRSGAIYTEKNPDLAQPKAIKKLASGNFLTSSRYCNWSNQAILVKRSFFLDFICRLVADRPDPRLVHGFQDIERALNKRWWRRMEVPMGFAKDGVFSHQRVDR